MPWQEIQPRALRCYTGRLCSRPYPGRPKGCPNFGTRATCPPQAKSFDLAYPGTWYAIWNVFDIGAHAVRMRGLQPEWTEKQCRCCLYWQGTARKQLRALVKTALREIQPEGHITDYVEYVPEAHGMDVTNTMKSIGVNLQWPPADKTVQVAVVFVEDGIIIPTPLKPLEEK